MHMGPSITTRLTIEPPAAVVAELAASYALGRNALADLKEAALMLIESGEYTEAGFAKAAGVDRMTVRNWRGKR